MSKRSVLTLIMVATAICTLAVGSATCVAASWQIRHIPTPVEDRVPTFISADANKIVWTGHGGISKDSRTYIYDRLAGKNKEITAPLPGSYFSPCIDGDKIVLQGHKLMAQDNIFFYGIGSSTLTRITTNELQNSSPRTQGGLVVWQKSGSDSGAGIYLYDAATGKTKRLLSGGEYQSPDIWGDHVVCLKAVVQDGKISAQVMLYDLVSGETKAITDDTHCHKHPRISAGKIVWSRGDAWVDGTSPSYRFDTHQIQVYDIASDTTTTLTDNKRANLEPCIRGDLVAWRTEYPRAIMFHDLSKDTTVQVITHDDAIGAPDIDGTTIVWFGAGGLYTAVSPENVTRFADVPKGHPNETAIEGLAARGIIDGYGNGYFGPNKEVIRQQFAKMIVLAMGYTVTAADRMDPDFKDAHLLRPEPGGLYPYHYVAKAALTGLTKGYDDGRFGPADKITRQQVITMAVRAAGDKLQAVPEGWSGELPYSDPQHGKNIRTAEYNGLVTGVTGPGAGLYGWNTTTHATRAECAQILWNLRTLVEPGD